MRTIVHISDLHFGHEDAIRVNALRTFINEASPHMVCVSGDLTQRARRHEFEAARAFIDSLNAPHIVIPGNHDVPLYDVFSRLTQPFAKYRKFFHEELEPSYADGEIIIVGLNSARGLTIKDGRLDPKQVQHAAERFARSNGAVKIVVTHHPFDVPSGHPETDIIGNAGDAMAVLAEAGADVFLAGHLHATHATSSFERYRIRGHAALVVHAGTATSSRVRGEENAFNVLHVDGLRIAVDHAVWRSDAFAIAKTSRFVRDAKGCWGPKPR
jgi:3',5'-cyclic AMP phosphodiesterase CpdA